MKPAAWIESHSILCLVTPGASGDSEYIRLLEEEVRAAIEAGIDLIQIREPALAAGVLCDLVTAAVDLRGGKNTRIVVNDRLDVALAACADGVHLGSRSIPAARVRELCPRPFIVGRSVHTVDEARTFSRAGAADYLIAGSVFATPSHPGETRLLGEEGLAAMVRATDVPVLGIGGITLQNMSAVARSGVAGIAAIGLFGGEPRDLPATVEKARRMLEHSPGVIE